MKKLWIMLPTLSLVLGTPPVAFAAATPPGYRFGVLTLIFFGFSTIVMVTQLLPAIVTLYGIIKGFIKRDSTL